MSLAQAVSAGRGLLRRVTIKGRSTSSSSKSASAPGPGYSLKSNAPFALPHTTSLSSARPLSERALRQYTSPSRFNFGRRPSAQDEEEVRIEQLSLHHPDSPKNNPLIWLGMAAAAVTTSATTSHWWEWSWKPTSAEKLRIAEERMLGALKTPFEQSLVMLENGEAINTLKMGQGPPLVMIHGFGGGLALFAANVEVLAKSHTVYAIDLPGFGRSSRPAFSGDTTAEAEEYFVSAFEGWMDAMKLDSAIIMGHSLGAYLSAVWAMRAPNRFDRLVLVDPFGVPSKPPDSEEGEWRKNHRVRAFIIDTIKAVSSSPLTLLRAAGPLGPGLVKRLRPDLIAKFAHLHGESGADAGTTVAVDVAVAASAEEATAAAGASPSSSSSSSSKKNSEIVADYIYHLNAQSPATGEEAFSKLLSKTGLGWAAEPLLDRLPLLNTRVPVSFIYGEDSWMNPLVGVQLRESMPNHNTDFVIIPDAGHHVYIDQWAAFNEYALMATQGTLNNHTKRQYSQLLRQLRTMAEEKALQAQMKSATPGTSQVS